MAWPALLSRLTAGWRSLSSPSRVRILLGTLAAVSLALRDLLLLATSAALLLVYEAARLAGPKPAQTP